MDGVIQLRSESEMNEGVVCNFDWGQRSNKNKN